MIPVERRRRVFLVGTESLSPLGAGKEELRVSLNETRRAGKTIERFDASELPVDAAAEVRTDLDPWLTVWPDAAVEVARHDRKLELALACASLAHDHFAAILEKCRPERRGLVVGMGLDVVPVDRIPRPLAESVGFPAELERLAAVNHLEPGVGRLFNLTDLPLLITSGRWDCRAFQEAVLTACSASSQALTLGYDAIASGRADAVVVGGTDSLLNLAAFAAFTKLGVIQPSRSGPATACRPFDRGRKGTMLGEGAGFALFVSDDLAESGGLQPTLEMLGYGNTLDGHHITAPDPTGSGMARAMQRALENSGVSPADIDHVNLHGTGTRANDPIELAALKRVFGEYATGVPVSSTKDRHGHLIAAAGIMEAIVLEQCMLHDLIPCTANLTNPIDPEMDLVVDENRSAPLRTCMSNSFAFGGINTSVVFRRVEA